MLRWIASYPKSGNTWVRLFLIAYENPAAFDINARPNHHRQDTFGAVYKAIAPLPLEDLTVEEITALRGAALVWINRGAGDQPAYVKTHCANIIRNGQAMVPPGLTEKAVYLVRDPRDVAVSTADHQGISIDEAIEKMADAQLPLTQNNIELPLMSWSLNVGSWTRELPYDQFTLRFEDLHADPERWLTFLLEFLAVPFDAERFAAALALTIFDSLRRLEDDHGFETKSKKQARFFREGKVGTWREHLTAAQAARIGASHGEQMARYSYA